MDAWTLHEKLTRKETGSWLAVKGVLAKMLMDRSVLSNDDVPDILDNFSLETILRYWSDSPVAYDVGIDHLPEDKERTILKEYLQKGESLREENPWILGLMYQGGLHAAQQKEKGVFYTPWFLIQTLIDELAAKPLVEKRILDPSCGAGFVLQGWYDRLMPEYQSLGFSEREAHELILKKNLLGMDVDPKAVAITALSLQMRQRDYAPAPLMGIGDFLLDSSPWGKVHLIAGNPPYIGHKQLDRDLFQKLKERYPDVFYDKADIAYCFFQRGLELLEDGGKLAFITSRYFMEAQNGRGIRRLIREKSRILSIYDYYGFRPIKEAKVDPAITFLQKESAEKGPETMTVRRYQYENKALSPPYEVPLSRLTQEGWILPTAEEDGILNRVRKKQCFLLQDVWESRQGIITGLDRAFVLDKEEAANYPGSYIHPWIKNSQVQAFKILDTSKRILYTDDLEDPETEPAILNRLSPYRERLAQRRECRLGRRPWHHLQWGRDQKFFLEEKVVYPYKSSSNRFAVDNIGSFYSADVYGFTIDQKKSQGFTNKSMATLLNSTLYQGYFQLYGKKLGRDLYEYYPNTLGRLPIPAMTRKDLTVLEDFYHQFSRGDEKQKQKTMERLDQWVFQYFELTKDEATFLLKSKGDRHEEN